MLNAKLCVCTLLQVAGLVSLSFPHYLLRSGVFTVMGAETAQALISGQIFYAFIRGAGKQYGVLWFANASVYSRFGVKSYSGTSLSLAAVTLSPGRRPEHGARPSHGDGTTGSAGALGGVGTPPVALCRDLPPANVTWSDPQCPQGKSGPTCGTSLNLFKRLMWSQYMYNSAYLSAEAGWSFPNGTLSPIGLIQAELRNFSRQHGR